MLECCPTIIPTSRIRPSNRVSTKANRPSDAPAATGRRYFLIAATAAASTVGVMGAAVPFVKSWTPSAKARAAGAPVAIDISRLQPGEVLRPTPAWRGQPVFVVARTAADIERLRDDSDELADPASDNPERQPGYARNPWRSRKPEIGVFLGICTHLGCSPKYHGEAKAEDFDANWKGGFYCPCHGSRFDLAGRVVKGVPAPDNLDVPPYSYMSDTEIIVGVDEETA